MKKFCAWAAVATLGLVTACGGSAEEKAGDGTLVFASTFAHTTLDPDRLPLRHMAMYTAPMYDSLFFLGFGEALEPMLATDWTSDADEQGSYLEMTLRSGLTFDDGTPFTSKTVALNIQRSQELEGSTNASVLRDVTVEEVSEDTVRLRREAGVGALPRELAGPAGMMISDQAILDEVDLTGSEAGIGAYNLDSVNPNRVVYTPADGYWEDGAAASDSLEIVYMADDAKANAVRTGEVDITILPEDLVTTAESAGYRVEYSMGTENYTFSVNTEIKPFDDPRVRKAINLAVDRQAMCDGLFDGRCEPTGQISGAGSVASDEDLGLENFPHDVEEAKRLIREAGAEGAKGEVVTVAGNQAFERLATTFQSQLKEIGLDIEVLPLAPPQVNSRFGIDKNVAMAFGATGNTFDPSSSLATYALPGGIYNPGGYADKTLVDKAAEAMLETDQEKRIEIYREISGALSPELFIVPVLTPETAYVLAEHVEGWTEPWGPAFPTFRGVSG